MHGAGGAAREDLVSPRMRNSLDEDIVPVLESLPAFLAVAVAEGIGVFARGRGVVVVRGEIQLTGDEDGDKRTVGLESVAVLELQFILVGDCVVGSGAVRVLDIHKRTEFLHQLFFGDGLHILLLLVTVQRYGFFYSVTTVWRNRGSPKPP